MRDPIKNNYKVLGIMSGSSLDGVDLVSCEFIHKNKNWSYSIIKAETALYDESWFNQLKEAPALGGDELIGLHRKYGKFLGSLARTFIEKNNLKVDLIASHGHTIFHQPENGYSFQLGEGQAIATTAGIIVVNDFRNKDIQLSGQGAPLVPIGDSLLFKEYDYCLNIGGIANISFDGEGKRIAFDICPANQLLNHLSSLSGKLYDKSGHRAKAGHINPELLCVMNSDSFYQKNYPKSLSNQYVQNHFLQIIDKFDENIQNKLRTSVEHIVTQIAGIINVNKPGKMLVTGGGAHNEFLISQMKEKLAVEVILPNDEMIDFKEGLLFAFMGVLRCRNEINCLASVTGAISDSCCGVIYQP